MSASFQALFMDVQGSVSTTIADLFVPLLWNGNSTTQPITGGINLASNEGAVMTHVRVDSGNQLSIPSLFNTLDGAGKYLDFSASSALTTAAGLLTSFNSDGITIDASTNLNESGSTYVGHCFRSFPGFFDVVQYTGNGTTQTIAHTLGATPGLVIIKKTSATGNWVMWHRSFAANNYSTGTTATLALVTTNTSNFFGNNSVQVTPDSANITVGSNTNVNANAVMYTAYLFGHDASGFVQCGSYTGNSSTSGPIVGLGWEPQYLMVARTGTPFAITDQTMGFAVGSDQWFTIINSVSNVNTTDVADPSGTGFQIKTTSTNWNQSGQTYYYLAIKK